MQLLRDVLRDALVVAAGTLVLAFVFFGATGVWPPMVAVESGSMEPHLERGDLVVLTDTGRLAPPVADGGGVVTAASTDEYRRLGATGDVLVFTPPERTGSPIIHRARFRVDAGENWYDRADAAFLPRDVDGCPELRYCPAPHAGYVTKGDDNSVYDQAVGRAPPVKRSWIRGKAQVAVPWLGEIRLFVAGA
ncbi:MAG: S26 family signal peptidase [Halobacteriota archaeon]